MTYAVAHVKRYLRRKRLYWLRINLTLSRLLTLTGVSHRAPIGCRGVRGQKVEQVTGGLPEGA